MKFVSVKKDKQLVLDGVTFDVTWSDGSIAAVLATDKAGNAVRFANESYNFKVTVKAPPRMVDRYELSGTVLGMGVRKLFEDEYEATKERQATERKVTSDEDCVLTVTKVEVPEDEVSA